MKRVSFLPVCCPDAGRLPRGGLSELRDVPVSIGVLAGSLLALLAGVLLAGEASAADDHNRYNVLFIAVDDLRPELGCYGAAQAQSPALDRLASQSVLFEHHYVQVPTCGASRYALLTGRSPARSGVTANNAAFYSGPSALRRETLPGAQTLPELLRRSGYTTCCIGKISHTPDGRVFEYNGRGDGRPELPHAWDALPTPFGPWKRGWGIFFAYADGRHREDGQGNRDLMEFRAESDDDLPDGLLARTAVEQLRQLAESEQPFFLGVGFFKPHLPFVAPRGDWEAIAEADVTLPAGEKVDSPYWHRSGEFYKYDAPFEKTWPLAPSAQRTARRAYLACVRYVDRQVGRVLDALDELGLADNTIVVVWGDHGWHLGEQQLWGKHCPFERALRSVLMIRVPRGAEQGTYHRRCGGMVESTDIYPTLVDLCRPRFTRTNHPLDGQSLAPLIRGEADSVRESAVSYWRDARGIRNRTHRLVARVRGDQVTRTELYDLTKDPDTVRDISRERPELVESLLRELERRVAPRDDSPASSP